MLDKLLVVVIVAVLLIAYNSVVAVFAKGIGSVRPPHMVAVAGGLVLLIAFGSFGLRSIHIEMNEKFVIAGLIVGWICLEGYRFLKEGADEDEPADI